MTPKRAFVTGVTGQDGSFLAELLLSKGYEVDGLVRRTSSVARTRIDHLREHGSFRLHYGDLGDGTNLYRTVKEILPDEVYNLAAQSHVRVSFDQPVYTADVVALGTLRLLEAVREANSSKPVKFYQASSSEMFGSSPPPQDERTPFRPRSPYACAKLYAHWQTVNYREAYGLFACNGILLNHESERRGETFVTRKITRAAARIKLGLQDRLELGNLDAKRDWGYAKDYVEAMWLMLQHDKPDDYVVATGEMHSVKEFLEETFGHFGLDWRRHVSIDPRFKRPSEVDALCGDARKARETLGWRPRVTFKELVRIMAEADLEAAKQETR